MSIYPVRLKNWFPKGDHNYEIVHAIVKDSKCAVCGKKPRYRYSIGYHALPWGYDGTVWCSTKCLRSK